MKMLNLTEIKGYAVIASVDERTSGITGYYSNYAEASTKTKGIGWYNSNGEVKVIDLYTDGDEIYEVKCLGKFADIANKEELEMISSIKSKLSPEEWEYLKKK